VRHVSCDFEHQDFGERLVASGFAADRPAVAAWLGVSLYLTGDAVRDTLRAVGSWPTGSAVVLDYIIPGRLWDAVEGYDGDKMRAVARSVAAAGEPWLSLFDGDEMTELLTSCGFDRVEIVDDRDIRRRYMPDRPVPPRGPTPSSISPGGSWTDRSPVGPAGSRARRSRGGVARPGSPGRCQPAGQPSNSAARRSSVPLIVSRLRPARSSMPEIDLA
jgi:hypothetical protein